MNNFSSISLGLVLSILSGACGTAINTPAQSASNHDRDGIVTSSEVEIVSVAKSNAPQLIACDTAGTENNLWSIPASSEEKLTREAAVAKLNQLYGNASRIAVQDCSVDPNQVASAGATRLLNSEELASN